MAKFIFKMENILSVKYKLEDQAKAEYGQEIARLREEEEKKKRLLEKKQWYQDRLKDALQDQLDIFLIKKLEDSVEIMKYQIRVQNVVILEQEKRVARAREKLDEAMKERKTYEKLKEKAFEAFRLELNAQEQKEVDELVSFRYGSAEESED